MTSGLEVRGRFGKQDFVYLSDEDAYRCPAGEKLTTTPTRRLGSSYGAIGPMRAVTVRSKRAAQPARSGGLRAGRHEHVLEEVQRRLDNNPHAMRQRRETVEHPFGTMKARMGATHFLTKTLPKVAAEMALSVLAYNLTRVMNIVGIKPLIAAIVA
jgi:Transposase DDE domain